MVSMFHLPSVYVYGSLPSLLFQHQQKGETGLTSKNHNTYAFSQSAAGGSFTSSISLLYLDVFMKSSYTRSDTLKFIQTGRCGPSCYSLHYRPFFHSVSTQAFDCIAVRGGFLPNVNARNNDDKGANAFLRWLGAAAQTAMP